MPRPGRRSTATAASASPERRLGAVDLGERLGAAALLLVGLGVGDGAGDLPGDQAQEAAVIVVEQPERIEAAHEGDVLLLHCHVASGASLPDFARQPTQRLKSGSTL
ncbi:hypothetical protein DLREEDagr8_33490 [Dongia sp. agr-C8]